MAFEIIKEAQTYSRRFKTNGRRIVFKIETIPDNTENPLIWVKDAIHGVVQHLIDNVNPDHKIGLTFSSENFKEKIPGYLSFRKAYDLTMEDVWRVLGSVFQSNSSGLSTDTFRMTATTVAPPKGSGKRVRKGAYASFTDECNKRRGIVAINNKDNLCLPRALVVGRAYVTSAAVEKIRRNRRGAQDRAVSELLSDSGVVIPEDGAGLEELAQFQKVLVEQIVVYEYGAGGRSVIFEGPDAPTQINLLLEDSHFAVITSLTAAFSCSYYCTFCHVPYDNKNVHRCSRTCPCCQTSPPCAQDINILCDSCNRSFRGQACYKRHIETRACGEIRRCRDCLKTIKANREHTCDEIFCKICSKHLPRGHLCYIKPDTSETKTNNLFLFFDIETRQEREGPDKPFGKYHDPNLLVYYQRCDECMYGVDGDDTKLLCWRCGVRKLVISRNGPIKSFVDYVLEVQKGYSNVVCIARNSQAFDGQFILRYILENTKHTPNLIMRGTKIILMSVGLVKFIDSLNYFPMALSGLPAAFGLGSELRKGYFPHLFNTLANANYVGSLPDIKFYSPDSMNICGHCDLSCKKSGCRNNFLKWYETHRGVEFNMTRDIAEYCVSDVDILAKACIAFRDMFIKECGVCPFTEAATLPAACNRVFRRNYLKANTIGVLPRGGTYRLIDTQSKIAIQWLISEAESRKIYIQHAALGREALVDGVRVDGYCPENREVFEFHGCYYHGHPSCFTSNRDEPMHDDPSDTLNSRYDRTIIKINRLRDRGYTVTEMWECDFRKQLGTLNLNNHPLLAYAPLNAREAFYGGRTGNTRLHYMVKPGEKIKYVDVCSLYPWVCKYGKFPVGHPEVVMDTSDLNYVEGLVKCTILPPGALYHPVLPYKMHKKLMFLLCRSCGEILSREKCTHSDEERALTGTWVIDEVQKALEKGYQLIKIHEIWKYKTQQYDGVEGGLFVDFINKFLRLKQQASGWPSNCTTETERKAYIESYLKNENVALEPSEILKNPGLRSLAKLILNSFWGKFGQREQQPHTTIFRDPSKYFALFNNPAIEVNNVDILNDDTVVVNWVYVDEAVDPLPTVNVVIAAYVTAQARLKLYSYLEMLGERVLYYDTDSVIYVSREGEPDVLLGNMLGEMTDELEGYGHGSYITDFVCTGPKSYAFSVLNEDGQRENVCKVKGIRLNYAALQLINFDTLLNMVLKDDNQVVEISFDQIARTSGHDVVTQPASKKFKLNFSKRCRINEDSLPYGHRT